MSKQLAAFEPGGQEPPCYRLHQPFFSAECRYYEVGETFVDMFGNTTPNESWEPLNRPAELRMHAYMATLKPRAPGDGWKP